MQYIEPRPGIGYVLLENFFKVSWSETFLFQAEQGKDFRKQVTPNPPTPPPPPAPIWFFYKSVIPW